MAQHKHWPKEGWNGISYEQYPVCPYPTKKACAAALSAWKAEGREEQRLLKEQREAARKAAREVAFLEHEHAERQRIATGGSPV
jgi:hypothetical protein